MPPAARVGDMHTCPMVTGVVPHVGGPILPPGCPTVLIGNMPAARVGDMATCVGPPDTIAKGSATVMIGNMPAARLGDQTAHGGVIILGCPTVMIGDSGSGSGGAKSDSKGSAPNGMPAAGKNQIQEAIKKIKDSNFAKTEEGKKVIKKLEDLDKAGKIGYEKQSNPRIRGSWGGGKISVNDVYKGDTDATASELVHEATHAVNEDEFPASKTKITIDEELRTNQNQVAFYKEQRKEGYRDSDLERRLDAREKGTLRDDVRSRYPGVPESL